MKGDENMKNIEVKFNGIKRFTIITNGKEEYKATVSFKSISKIIK